MAYDLKYGKVTVEHEPGNPFGDDEPVIVFRARDKLAKDVISHYSTLADIHGLPSSFIDKVIECHNAFSKFEIDHPELMKYPD